MYIQRLNGTTYDLSDYGMKTLGINISSPSPRTIKEQIDNRHGFIDTGTTFEGRVITASFYMSTDDIYDFRLYRNELFNTLRSDEYFYIIDKKEGGKRWKVKVDRSFDINQMGRKGTMEIVFISNSPFAESIGTTTDGFTFEADVWGIGMGLSMDADYNYTHSTNTFTIQNLGTEKLDPRELPLLITFQGPSTNLEIRNLTTGDTWSYTGSTVSADVIELNGIKSSKNSISIFGDTNYKVITLANGTNDFEIVGTTGDFTISFDFRFYYI